MTPVFWSIIAYIAAQLLIGIFVSRRIRNESDYLLAGRSLGFWLASLSVFATWFGAETCIGAAGAVYEGGLAAATIDPFGYSLCLVFMGLFFASRLWRRNLTTLGDLFRQRYGQRVETLAILLMVPGTIMWAAAQIRAFGQVLSAISGFEVELAIASAALVVVVYTVYGGLLADVITDAVQGIALIIGLAVLFYLVIEAGGGWQASFQAIEPQRLAFRTDSHWLETVEHWAIPVCGSLLSQELISRVLASRAPEVARRACLAGGLLYLAVGLMPVAMGLMGWNLLPGLDQPEQILPKLAEQYLHGALYVIFAGALISAILSTVDSALMAVSALLAHNLIIPRLQVQNEKRKVLITRAIVCCAGVIAYSLALHAERIYTLVENASAFGSAGIFIVVIFGLFSRIGHSYSAAAALLTGIGVWIMGNYLADFSTPYLAALGAAAACYLAVAGWEHFYPRRALQ